MRGLSLVVASGDHSSLRYAGLSLSRPLVAEHRLQMRRLSSCGSRAQLLRGMWDLPRLGLEPMSPALAGRISTNEPPGKPLYYFIKFRNVSVFTTHLVLHILCLQCCSKRFLKICFCHAIIQKIFIVIHSFSISR